MSIVVVCTHTSCRVPVIIALLLKCTMSIECTTMVVVLLGAIVGLVTSHYDSLWLVLLLSRKFLHDGIYVHFYIVVGY